MSITIYQDLSTAQVGNKIAIPLTSPGVVPKSIGNKLPKIVINNESGCGVECDFSGGRTPFLSAGAWTEPLELTAADVVVNLIIKYVLPNSPVNTFAVTIYRPDEQPLKANVLGNSPIGISGNVQTSNVQSLTNDGSAPETVIIETTPSDQTSSSYTDRNTGSGFRQILSAGVLRTVWQFVRGNITSLKAALQLGDPNDTSILTIYGTIGTGSVVPGATVSGGVASASTLSSTLSTTNLGASPNNKPTIKTNQTAGSTYDLYASTFDGTTQHDALMVDHLGKRFSDNTSQITPSGAKVNIQSTAPASPATYDSWLKTSF